MIKSPGGCNRVTPMLDDPERPLGREKIVPLCLETLLFFGESQVTRLLVRRIET